MLSRRQKEVLDYIKKFIEEREYSPSYQEICDGTGVSSRATVFKHIKSLMERGFLKSIGGKKRSLYLTAAAGSGNSEEEPSLLIPLYGYIKAGYPVEAVQMEETVSIPESLALNGGGRKVFALRVSGNSMEGDMIIDKDVIVLKNAEEVPNGRIVAAIIDGYEATLKRYYRLDGGKVKLMPSNPEYEPIILEAVRVKVIGELVGLLRKY